jgi:hypothetical protein
MFLARKFSATLLGLSLALATACQKREPTSTDQSTKAQTSTPAATTDGASTASSTGEVAPPHSISELQGVTARIYKEAVIVDSSRNDNFVVGDFNGDGSQDIAVIVRPGKGMLPELNSEYANWIREDAFDVGKLAAQTHEQQPNKKRKPTVITAGDRLLAVIHGHQAAGWRNPMATQTYLVKNAVGEKLSAQTARSLLNDAANRQQLPPLRGDVIHETLAGTPGFLYWTGARYAWHPSVN